MIFKSGIRFHRGVSRDRFKPLIDDKLNMRDFYLCICNNFSRVSNFYDQEGIFNAEASMFLIANLGDDDFQDIGFLSLSYDDGKVAEFNYVKRMVEQFERSQFASYKTELRFNNIEQRFDDPFDPEGFHEGLYLTITECNKSESNMLYRHYDDDCCELVHSALLDRKIKANNIKDCGINEFITI